ncbi:MAG: PAS domain S-box protein [Pedobacter sp.]|nr:PAS domain S-box protein [Pedobacter sp.]
MRTLLPVKSIVFYLVVGILLLLIGDRAIELVILKSKEPELQYQFLYKDIILVVAVAYITYFCVHFYLSNIKMTSIHYQKLFAGSPYAIYVMEKKSLKFLAVNEAMTDLYGYTEEEFLSMTTLAIRPEEERARIVSFLNTFGDTTSRSGKWLHQKKNGEKFYVSITFHAVPLFNKETYLVMVTDISQAILDETKTSDLLHLYETVNKATNDVIWDYDLTADELHWMQGYQETYGYADHGSTSNFWMMPKVYYEDRQKTIDFFKQLVADRTKSWSIEYRYVSVDGSLRYIEDRGFVIFNENEIPVRLIGAMQDVTQHKEYEQQLLSQNEYLKEIAWINSHQVRRPLCNIMGLVELIKNPDNSKEDTMQFIEMLSDSSKELDDAVIQVNKQAVDGKVQNTQKVNFS